MQVARIILGGAIADGETVLVSYRYQSDPSAKLGTLTRSFGAGLSLWSALTLRYRLSLVQEELLGGTPPETMTDDTIQSVSAQLTYDWSDTLLTADEEKRAAGNSIRRWKVTQSFPWRPRPNLSLAVSGSYGESELLESGSSGRAYGLRASGQWQPRANQQWRMEAFQNITTTDSPTRIESSGLGLFYVWRYAVWSVEADYRYLLDEQPLVDQERTVHSMNLSLRRALY